jgi:uncharacterized protein (DUF1778 family)
MAKKTAEKRGPARGAAADRSDRVREAATLDMHVRLTPDDRELFSAAARDEGFNTLSQWVIYHLRRQARQLAARPVVTAAGGS